VSDADIVLMRVVDGVGEIIDASARARGRPPTDPIQNVELLAAFENDGQTFVSYRYVVAALCHSRAATRSAHPARWCVCLRRPLLSSEANDKTIALNVSGGLPLPCGERSDACVGTAAVTLASVLPLVVRPVQTPTDIITAWSLTNDTIQYHGSANRVQNNIVFRVP
jgi:hypothetical protein